MGIKQEKRNVGYFAEIPCHRAEDILDILQDFADAAGAYGGFAPRHMSEALRIMRRAMCRVTWDVAEDRMYHVFNEGVSIERRIGALVGEANARAETEGSWMDEGQPAPTPEPQEIDFHEDDNGVVIQYGKGRSRVRLTAYETEAAAGEHGDTGYAVSLNLDWDSDVPIDPRTEWPHRYASVMRHLRRHTPEVA